jgi:hypothetical protein
MLRAQGAEDAEHPRVWKGSAQANASIFFGNTEQRVVGVHTSLARADSALEVRGDVQALYGDASVGGEPRTVTKRSWLTSLSIDVRPLDRTSPFAFGTVESNFEKRIATRYSLGVGAKETLVRTDRTNASISLALLDERTYPSDSLADLPTERVTRWSWRARVRHKIDDRVRVSHETFWRPSARALARYLVLSTTEVNYMLTAKIGLSLSFFDNYDSEAVRRGARSYNDGQFLFGVSTEW